MRPTTEGAAPTAPQPGVGARQRAGEWLAAERFIADLPPPTGVGRAVLLYPNRYALGMSNLALHTLWRLLAAAGWDCDRAFLDPVPGRSLRLNLLLAEFDLVCVHCSWEMDYLHLPLLLEAGGVAALSASRAAEAPLVIAGGPAVSANPAPLAPLCDLLFIGEVEPAWEALGAALALAPSDPAAAREQAAALPGVYCPSLPSAQPVRRQVLEQVDGYPTASVVVTPHAELSDMFLLEAGRGCPGSCRFCLARRLYHPFRPRRLPALLGTARPALAVTRRIGLVGAALSDHPRLLELCEALAAEGAQLSTSSLRLDRLTPRLLELLAAGGARSVTLAPEAGAEPLRRALGKPFTDEQIFAAAEMVQEAGLHAAKLYFLVGAPGETEADRRAIGALVAEVLRRAPRLRLEVALSPLVPKPHTPWESLALPPLGQMRAWLQQARRGVERLGLRVTAGSAREALMQTALSRGGPELGPVLAPAARRGGSFAALRDACREAGLRLENYREPPAAAPWRVVEMAPCGEKGGEPRGEGRAV